ncbi:MAG: hypothetical protein JNL28_13090 [Planctomycetes bacterium]|nr:hypothetical protein [Planctomycetota bacterium]
MNWNATLLACLLAVCAAFSAACQSRPPAQWVDATVEAPSDHLLWEVTLLSLQKTGFPLGTGLDRAQLLAVSGWNAQLAPFRSDGFRERAHIEYKPLGERKYGLKVRVEREINQDISHPLDLSYAQWEPDRDNVTRAQILLGYIKATLGPRLELNDPK